MYKTKDLYLSCVLLSNNIKFIKSEKGGTNNTVFFIFDSDGYEEEINTLINQFINQECYVNVKKFTWAMKILKKEIYKWRI